MFSKTRLVLCVAACLLLSNCQLINTALRLAPLLMMVEKTDAQDDQTLEMRGREIEQKGPCGLIFTRHQVQTGLVFKH